MGKLQDKVAIVTGAASGMGAATAKLFAAEGAKVVLCDINREQGETTAAGIGGGAIFRYLDIRDDAGWGNLVAELDDTFGSIDILLNNAAIVRMWPIEAMDVEQARAMVDTNIFGALLSARNVAPVMRRAGRGVIINVSSLTGVIGMNGLSAYSASKWAVRGLTRSLALELGPAGIRVCTIVPGGINTPMNNSGTASVEELNRGYRHVPLQRIGEPIEVARASLFLASDDASYITGAELIVDGGDAAGYYQPGLPGAPAGFVLGGLNDEVLSMGDAKALERIAMLYIDALLTADDTIVPLATDVKRAHLMVLPGAPCAWQIAEGADTVRADIRRERLTARKDVRVTVDPERSTVVVLWESAMDFDGARAITIMDRFVIRDGEIAELEIISIPQGQAFERVPYAGWPGG